jgi:hypothetical protein
MPGRRRNTPGPTPEEVASDARATPLGPDVVDYLAWKRLSRAAERTLDQYERDLRLVCFAVGYGIEGIPARKPSHRERLETRTATRFKAPGGFEPPYEALQASA